MLRAFLISIAAAIFSQSSLQILGLDFNVVRVLEISEQELIVEFTDKSIVTTPKDLEEVVLNYHLQAQKIPISQLKQLISNCLKSDKFNLCNLALQHYCSASDEAYSKLEFLRKALSEKQIASRLDLKKILSEGADFECLFAFILAGTDIETPKYIMTNHSELIYWLSYALENNILTRYAKAFNLVIASYSRPEKEILQVGDLLQLLIFLLSPKNSVTPPHTSTTLEEIYASYNSVISKAVALPNLNCHNYLALLSQIKISSAIKVENCISSVLKDPTVQSISLINICKSFQKDCYKAFFELLKDPPSSVKNAINLIELNLTFNFDKNFSKKILYFVELTGDKTLARLLETKYNLKLSALDHVVFFLSSFWLTIFLIFLTTLAAIAALLMFKTRRKVTETNEAAGSSFVRFRQTQKPVNQELLKLLQYFGLGTKVTVDEIKKRYRQLAKELHPDSPTGSHEKFQELQENYLKIQQFFDQLK